jgi:hypothetical protein
MYAIIRRRARQLRPREGSANCGPFRPLLVLNADPGNIRTRSAAAGCGYGYYGVSLSPLYLELSLRGSSPFWNTTRDSGPIGLRPQSWISAAARRRSPVLHSWPATSESTFLGARVGWNSRFLSTYHPTSPAGSGIDTVWKSKRSLWTVAIVYGPGRHCRRSSTIKEVPALEDAVGI